LRRTTASLPASSTASGARPEPDGVALAVVGQWH
jgi:hypothetical protein